MFVALLNKMGIVYLIQPAELVGTDRYKVGCSSESTLKRLTTGYKKGYRCLQVHETSEPFRLEQCILCNYKEASIETIAGNEYFKGDETTIRHIFMKTCMDFDKVPLNRLSIASKPIVLTHHVHAFMKDNYEFTGDHSHTLSVPEIKAAYKMWYNQHDYVNEPMLKGHKIFDYIKQYYKYGFVTNGMRADLTGIVNRNVMEMTD